MNNDEWIHVSPFTGRTSSLPGTDYFNSCCKASINLETPWLLATNEVTVAGSSPGGRAPENIISADRFAGPYCRSQFKAVTAWHLIVQDYCIHVQRVNHLACTLGVGLA